MLACQHRLIPAHLFRAALKPVSLNKQSLLNHLCWQVLALLSHDCYFAFLLEWGLGHSLQVFFLEKYIKKNYFKKETCICYNIIFYILFLAGRMSLKLVN